MSTGFAQRCADSRLSSSFGAMLLPLPPPAEQAAIVRFLDWANGRLERAIRAKRKVIALLNEQKQAIIHRAVTRGLDPSVPLKPSGIPWLGDIPQHWEVRLSALYAGRASWIVAVERSHGRQSTAVRFATSEIDASTSRRASSMSHASEMRQAIELVRAGDDLADRSRRASAGRVCIRVATTRGHRQSCSYVVYRCRVGEHRRRSSSCYVLLAQPA